MKTGFIGLGAMGAHMAANLSRAGLLHGVWNRTASTAAAVAADLGCIAAADPASLARDCDVIVTCVSADEDVLAMVDAVAGPLGEGVVIDCSTTKPETAREAARRLAPAAQFVDCPVTGGTEGARLGTLAMLGGGDEAAWQRVLPALQAMGKTVERFGPVGAGQSAKAINQVMVAGINQAVSEGMALADREGLPLQPLIDALSTGAAASWFLTNRAPNMIRGEYPLGFKVSLHEKDLRICQEMAAAHNVHLPLVEMTLLHYKRVLASDPPDEDISSLFRLKAAMFDEAAARAAEGGNGDQDGDGGDAG